jgi:hypothetical protein
MKQNGHDFDSYSKKQVLALLKLAMDSLYDIECCKEKDLAQYRRRVDDIAFSTNCQLDVMLNDYDAGKGE